MELPLSPRDRVEVLAADAEHVYIWWSLSAPGASRARAALPPGPAHCVLRVYAAGAHRDLEVDDWLGSARLKVPTGARVVAATGFRAGEAFAHVARSAALQLPRKGPAEAELNFSTMEAEVFAPLRLDDQPESEEDMLRGNQGLPAVVRWGRRHRAGEPRRVEASVPAGAAAVRSFRLSQALPGRRLLSLESDLLPQSPAGLDS